MGCSPEGPERGVIIGAEGHSLAMHDPAMPEPLQPPAAAKPPVPAGVQSAGQEELIVVGRVVAAQGLQGEVRVLPLSDFPERFTRPGPRWLQRRQEPPRLLALQRGRQLPGKELFVVRFEGIDSRTAAEELVGHELLVSGHDRPPLEEGEFHVLDLVGLEVRLLPGGEVIGHVVDLLHGGNDLLEVESSDGPEGAPRRRLIPFVEAIVPEVHLEQGWIGIDPPPGLLDL
jgi:16S rRNA processing protein RimM